jgi:hypothetical protein
MIEASEETNEQGPPKKRFLPFLYCMNEVLGILLRLI